MIASIIFLLIGVLAGWGTSYYFYSRQKKEAQQEKETQQVEHRCEVHELEARHQHTKGLLDQANNQLYALRQDLQNLNVDMQHQTEQLAALRTENAELKTQVGAYQTRLKQVEEYADPRSSYNTYKTMRESMDRQNQEAKRQMELHKKSEWMRTEMMRDRHSN